MAVALLRFPLIKIEHKFAYLYLQPDIEIKRTTVVFSLNGSMHFTPLFIQTNMTTEKEGSYRGLLLFLQWKRICLKNSKTQAQSWQYINNWSKQIRSSTGSYLRVTYVFCHCRWWLKIANCFIKERREIIVFTSRIFFSRTHVSHIRV